MLLDLQEFPRETEGLDYSLNWSLADDGVTPHGEAFRNASLTRLLMHSSGSLSKSKAIDVPGAAQDAPSFATDEFKGFSVMDIDEFEARSEEVCRDAVVPVASRNARKPSGCLLALL